MSMIDFPLWNLDTRKIGVAIGDVNGKLYNWVNSGWDVTSNPIYGTHIRPLTSPFQSGSVCANYTQITIPSAPLTLATGPCVLMFDISSTGSPTPCDLLGNPFLAVGPYPTRPSFGFR